MTGQTPSSETVIAAATQLRSHFDAVMSGRIPDRLRHYWTTEWRGEIDRILEENDKRPEVVISLIGGTGSGKSTLLNALLGTRVLPVSNMRACTAAIAEVRYAEHKRYHVRIEFMSRQDWQKEVAILLEDIADSASPRTGEDGDEFTEPRAISRAAADKIRAVYGLPDELTLTRDVLSDLHETPAIAEALDRRSLEVNCDTLDRLRGQIHDYLDSKRPFWPIVQRVRITGPFDILKSGAVIVDLPGINDPNEAREQITRRYLKTCRFIWIVFNIKRALTRDIKTVLHSEEFIRQIVMDGREGALTLVGTASDEFDPDSAIDELGLKHDSTDADIAAARNKTVRERVVKDLQELVQALVDRTAEPAYIKKVTEALLRSQVFTVSSLEYLRLTGQSKRRIAILEREDQTEIPQLREHVGRICAAFGPEARALAHHRQLVFLLQRVAREYLQTRSSLKQEMTLTDKKRKELIEAMNRLAAFLGQSLEDHL